MQSSIVTKLLSLLTIINKTRTQMAFSELAAKSGMNTRTTHRLLAICAEEHLVQFDTQGKTYFLGPQVFDLVQSAYSSYNIQAVALNEMVRLHGQFDANITIDVPSGMDVVYLCISESSSAFGSIQRLGMREQVHCSASGKALLAFLANVIID